MTTTEQPDGTHRPLDIADQGCFFVGGTYVDGPQGRIMAGQMFVQYQIPRRLRYRYPIVMIHGGGQTGVNFLGTPDGRRGWADDFLAHGYAVYVIDQPARGRSGYHAEAYGESAHRDAQAIANRFSAPERANAYPQARLHTQWPGSGVPGDAVFDQFYASQVASMVDVGALEGMMRNAGSALLERIGPSVLLTHSQGGPFGWTIADARPRLVRAVVAVEPNGAPLYEVKFTGPPDYFEDDVITRPWGITRGPLTFDPPAAAADLRFEREPAPDAPDLVRCWVQAEPPRRLRNLQGIPILIVTGEASYHAPYDHCTSKFLRQAGVAHDFVRLQDVGIRGNGHMMMLEKNNLEIAAFLRSWIESKVPADAGEPQ